MFAFRAPRSWSFWYGLLALAVGVFLVAACGDDTGSDTTTGDAAHSGEFAFGEPADAADADRVIEIAVGNELTFTPDSVTVSAGEVVTFQITNTGALDHDFLLGDEETQQEHEAEMMESGEAMEHSDPNAVSAPARETVELTWHFTQPGTVIFGCHVAGHYAGGMKGTITVES